MTEALKATDQMEWVGRMNSLKRLEISEPSEEHIQKTVDLCRAAYSSRRRMRPLSTPQMILSQTHSN